MKKRTLTLNKADWSGETLTIEIREEKGIESFELDGYEFRLIPRVLVEDTGDGLGSCTRYEIRGKSWDYPLGFVDKWSEDRLAFASDEIGSETGIRRENSDPAIAAIQLLCNVL